MRIEFRDLSKAFLKGNYHTLFIDKIVDECEGNKIFSFMDGFSGYNKISIRLEDQDKATFIHPWGTFEYKICLLASKMLELHFSRPCLMLSMTSCMSSKHTWMI